MSPVLGHFITCNVDRLIRVTNEDLLMVQGSKLTIKAFTPIIEKFIWLLSISMANLCGISLMDSTQYWFKRSRNLLPTHRWRRFSGLASKETLSCKLVNKWKPHCWNMFRKIYDMYMIRLAVPLKVLILTALKKCINHLDIVSC